MCVCVLSQYNCILAVVPAGCPRSPARAWGGRRACLLCLCQTWLWLLRSFHCRWQAKLMYSTRFVRPIYTYSPCLRESTLGAAVDSISFLITWVPFDQYQRQFELASVRCQGIVLFWAFCMLGEGGWIHDTHPRSKAVEGHARRYKFWPWTVTLSVCEGLLKIGVFW